jgi:hypothetical protein
VNNTVYRIFVTSRVMPKEVETSGPREYFIAHYHIYRKRPHRLEEEHRPEEAPPEPPGVCGIGITPAEALERLHMRLRSLGAPQPPNPKTRRPDEVADPGVSVSIGRLSFERASVPSKKA